MCFWKLWEYSNWKKVLHFPGLRDFKPSVLHRALEVHDAQLPSSTCGFPQAPWRVTPTLLTSQGPLVFRDGCALFKFWVVGNIWAAPNLPIPEVHVSCSPLTLSVGRSNKYDVLSLPIIWQGWRYFADIIKVPKQLIKSDIIISVPRLIRWDPKDSPAGLEMHGVNCLWRGPHGKDPTAASENWKLSLVTSQHENRTFLTISPKTWILPPTVELEGDLQALPKITSPHLDFSLVRYRAHQTLPRLLLHKNLR